MFFSMKTAEMLGYASYFEDIIRSSIDIYDVGSEQILHRYVFSNGIDYEWLPSLGLVRREEVRTRFLRLPKQRWDVI